MFQKTKSVAQVEQGSATKTEESGQAIDTTEAETQAQLAQQRAELAERIEHDKHERDRHKFLSDQIEAETQILCDFSVDCQHQCIGHDR